MTAWIAREVIGTSENGTAYIADGTGVYDTTGTGDAAWNLGPLHAGGNTALSFADAFVDIKVSEIISQPLAGTTPVRLHAGMPLLLASLGAFGIARVRS